MPEDRPTAEEIRKFVDGELEAAASQPILALIDSDLEFAQKIDAMVDAAAGCGASAVKFQTHLADQESTERERFRVKVFPQDETRQDYWRRTAFDLSQWKDLAEYSRSKGLVFLSSPFSNRAVEWLQQCDVPAWKIAR